jgi:hypothetical protein
VVQGLQSVDRLCRAHLPSIAACTTYQQIPTIPISIRYRQPNKSSTLGTGGGFPGPALGHLLAYPDIQFVTARQHRQTNGRNEPWFQMKLTFKTTSGQTKTWWIKKFDVATGRSDLDDWFARWSQHC